LQQVSPQNYKPSQDRSQDGLRRLKFDLGWYNLYLNLRPAWLLNYE
jgi:hypothetical protein